MAPSTFDIVVLSSSPPDNARTGASAVAPQSRSPASPFNSTQRVGMPALSPLQLSPLASPQRRTFGALKSGPRAATIPEGALRGFATARSLVTAGACDDDDDDDDDELQEFDWELAGTSREDGERGKGSSKGSRKRSEKAVAAGDDAEKPKPNPKPRARKPNADEENGETTKPTTTRKQAFAPTTSSHFANPDAIDSVESLDEPPKKATKPRKPRAKKTPADGDTQTTSKKARVTKPRATKTTKAAKEKAAGVVSAHFRDATDGDKALGKTKDTADAPGGDESLWDVPLSPPRNKCDQSKPKQQQPDNQPLKLDEAVSRRRDWTPIRDTEPPLVLPVSVGKENDSGAARLEKEKGSFTSLLSGYAYAHLDLTSDAATSKTPATSEGMGVMKRRRVELVDVPGNQVSSRQSSPEKGKAPKKKPRTITDLVTEQYAPKPAHADEVAVTSNFFSARTTTTTVTKVPLNDTTDSTTVKASKKPARKRSTSKSASETEEGKSKSKSKKASAKAGTAKPKPISEKLLSPSSALLRLNRQDVLFGTSSQLARDESPGIVRQIQQAMLESEVDVSLRERLDAEEAPIWPRLQRLKGKRGLWAASARDEDGQTLERQAIYLPEPDRTQDYPLLLIDDANDEDDMPPLQTVASAASKPAPAPMLISSDLPTPPPTVSEQEIGMSNDGLLDEALLDDKDDPLQKPPPSNQYAASSFLDNDIFPPSAQLSPDSDAPLSPLLPTASISTTSIGSPKKKRGRPLKIQSAIPQRVTASAPIPKKPPAKPKPKPTSSAPLTTPKKKIRDRFANVEEILDSEDDTALSPTPPRFRKLEDSPPLQFAPNPPHPPPPAAKDAATPILLIPESHLHFANIKSTLYTRITNLIRSLPPTTHPTKPSWHEKILMYDAVVLEDFTAFLNSHPGIRTYRKASQKQIRAWNKELKGKGEEGLKTPAGEGKEGMVLATEKEIESWMVRGWCEEMSVCCMAREGRGRGAARKGYY
ncbi:hypothetical protein K458DRAFT_480656 [Lentithecium fluviatile CBS 122367]|uniref:Structure-specific endonuclease subunit SLX4 n=1 Tax=Lentithecium fluviatile CBS 122367 TaxID=1168545 RepID=A0A6G1IKW7_9PLEO|nr:hypothetical protein K458DRAFT_480656 [Lentithecium fluviatile CBS 122367]